MFTLDQFKAIILENEKLQKEIDSLKEQLFKQNVDTASNSWKQRALAAEAQLEALNRKAIIEVIPQDNKWDKIEAIVNSDIENVLNAAVNMHVELFNLGIKTAKNEVIERYFILNSEGNYVKR